MATFIGSRLRIETTDGTYEGIAKSLDLNHGRVTLDKVVSVKDGIELKGLQHFFRGEIKNLVQVEEKKEKRKVKVTPDESGPSLLKKKQMPGHLKKYTEISDRFDLITDEAAKDANTEDSNEPGLFTQVPFGADPPVANDVSASSKPQEATSPETPAVGSQFDDRYLKHYTVIDAVNQDFKLAIRHIHIQKIIGFAIEGVNIGRKGKLCWIQVCTNDHVLLFDMVKLGKHGVTEGLASVVETPRVMKVLHDCRTYSDLFFHQYGIKMVNIFDTQVACVMLYRMANDGIMPRYVEGLSVTLHLHLGVPQDAVSWGKYRQQHQVEDQNIWAIRPPHRRLVDCLVQKVRYLPRLRIVLMEKMLADFTNGVDLYLSSHRDVSLDQLAKHENSIHLLPSSFKDLAYEAAVRREDFNSRYSNSRFQGRRDKNGFQENAVALFDSKMVFSHDSIWHGGYKNYRKEDNQQAKHAGHMAARNREWNRYQASRQEEEETLIKPRSPPSQYANKPPPAQFAHKQPPVQYAHKQPPSRQVEEEDDFDDDDALVSHGRSTKRYQKKSEDTLVLVPAGTDMGAWSRDLSKPTSSLPPQLHRSIEDCYDDDDDDESFVSIPQMRAKGTLLGRKRDSEGNSSYSSESEPEPSLRSLMQGVKVSSAGPTPPAVSTSGVGRGLLASQLLLKTSPGGGLGSEVKATGDDAAWDEVTRNSYQGSGMAGIGRGLRMVNR